MTNYKTFSIKDLEPVNKGACIAKFSMYFPDMKCTMRDCKVMEKNGTRWINLPNREYTSPSGEKKYFNYFHFDTESDKIEFNEFVLRVFESEMVGNQQLTSMAPF